jgi:hypothetical protein
MVDSVDAETEESPREHDLCRDEPDCCYSISEDEQHDYFTAFLESTPTVLEIAAYTWFFEPDVHESPP